jgi:Fur family ferric uptake transcriptional regulator
MHETHLNPQQLGGFQLLFHTLEFFGLCPSCQERLGSA